MANFRCSQCRFFQADVRAELALDKREGECRKNPPVPLAVFKPDGAPVIVPAFPRLNAAAGWCGDFESSTVQ